MNLERLANLLGMSKTTVSRALNGYPEVSERTRERVLQAARDNGYQANPMARSLALGRSNVFGIIYPLQPADLGDAMFLDVVAGMSAALEQDGTVITSRGPGTAMDFALSLITVLCGREKRDTVEQGLVRDK